MDSCLADMQVTYLQCPAVSVRFVRRVVAPAASMICVGLYLSETRSVLARSVGWGDLDVVLILFETRVVQRTGLLAYQKAEIRIWSLRFELTS